ncbi:DUF975 family protein [Streptococcus himalayensis]|uniref:Membrane protein n=1 Tax=Streptococcus himalayensis TaxID=1888195 RepID=A0A917EF28_9STRE|nr:DUF975 family protein [Streptococcus himalayensis]GGE32833.1 membrane protein [Streptococcus himalayensis]
MDIRAIRAEARQVQATVKGIRLLFLVPILTTICSSLFNFFSPNVFSVQSQLQPQTFFSLLFNRSLFPIVINFVLLIFITSAFSALSEVLRGKQKEVNFQDSIRLFQGDVFGAVFSTLFVKRFVLFLWSLVATIGLFLICYSSIVILNLAFSYPNGIPLALEGRFGELGNYLIAGLILMFIGLAISIPQIYAYSQVEFILCDQLKSNHYQGPWAILRASRRMMKGYKGSRFILDLNFIGWYILSSFTFGILAIYVYPYIYASHAIFYEHLKAKQANL